VPPGRRLSPAERALWARVAADVRPVRGAAVPDFAKALDLQPPMLAEPRPRPLPAASIAPKPKAAAQNHNTLDASWDRKLATGAVAPDVTIDLHGCWLDQAHERLDHGIARSLAHGARLILLVTGRPPRAGTSRLDLPLRGIIRASVHDWIAAGPYAGRIAAIRNAHPRHGGTGALYIILRRVRD